MSATVSICKAASVEDVQAVVRSADKVIPTGAGTKPALARSTAGVTTIDMRKMSGIVEYEPAEYTITARAGTPVAEVEQVLRENGQYLPFDPVFVRAGSTVGGMVASGLSGSGRLRYGGIRDFILGARFLDGKGRLIRGGGKVVKNAAGFDFPKLLVGSLGSLGIVVDASFKVFPRPNAYATVLVDYDSLDAALNHLQRLSVSPAELIAMDLTVTPGEQRYTLVIRIGGAPELLDARLAKLQEALPESTALQGSKEATLWADISEFAWTEPSAALVKIPLTSSAVPAIEKELGDVQHTRRYSVAGNVLWLPWYDSVHALGSMLARVGLSGVVLRGETTDPLIGAYGTSAFAKRVKAAIDPDDVFQTIDSE